MTDTDRAQPGARAGSGTTEVHPELLERELVRGSKPGERYVRLVRPQNRVFRRVAPGHLEARDSAHEAHSGLGKALQRVRRLLIGRPLATSQQAHERLTKIKALAVLSSDALSSSAYATEEIVRVLVLAGAAALSLTLPVAAAITTLLVIVAISYMQTIKAYPHGGGSYIVTKDNLGTWPSLVAGSALMIDYILTVAVSISAGVAALTSAVQDLRPFGIQLGVGFILLITVGNLRGIRESGSIFAAPTYLFVLMAFAMIGVGVFRIIQGDIPSPAEVEAHVTGPLEALSILLVLKAFASGNAALTGLEAISDGVPAFQPPEWKNARTTLMWMAAILGTLFMGISFLTVQFTILPSETETIISQLGRLAFGSETPLYFLFQAATMLILVLAANTAFSDFPRLGYFLARDRFLPSLFQFRGERLAFSAGIVSLAIVSSLLMIAFNADTHALIPLYAVGVFLSFTLSQSGMVVRWWQRREAGWQTGLPINALGALCTGVVTIVVATEKFSHGAWMVILLIPLLVLMLRAINAHYISVADELAIEGPGATIPEAPTPIVLVPVPNLNRATLQTLSFANSISEDVTALFVTDDLEEAAGFRKKWSQWEGDTPLVVLESPYRALTAPLLAYIDAQRERHPNRTILVVLGEFVPRHWWEWLLHGQAALRLKAALFFRKNVVVADVPYHLTR
jgi:amino acid transporter